MINRFRNEYFFLSNFFPSPIKVNGLIYPSVENAFQAFKTTDKSKRILFTKITPLEARRLGRKIELRSDWEKIKLVVMYKLVYIKFSTNPELKKKLLATNDEILVEGNNYGDSYWGVITETNFGKNYLGKILMRVRKVLRTASK